MDRCSSSDDGQSHGRPGGSVDAKRGTTTLERELHPLPMSSILYPQPLVIENRSRHVMQSLTTSDVTM